MKSIINHIKNHKKKTILAKLEANSQRGNTLHFLSTVYKFKFNFMLSLSKLASYKMYIYFIEIFNMII